MPLLSLRPSPVYAPTNIKFDETFEDNDECQAFNESIKSNRILIEEIMNTYL